MSELAIRTAGLSKEFQLDGTVIPVLEDVELSIEEGEFVSLTGPSGSGKSTLLYLIGGLDRPTRGEVWIEGREIIRLSDREASLMRRRTLGFIFQFYNLVPNLNVEDNILLPILLDGKRLKDYAERLEEILSIVGLTDRRRHTPRELSGGQQQRVAIARALIYEPRIILADEPTGNLDSRTGNEVMELLAGINREQKKTIVLVTHSEHAASFATRRIRMQDGRIGVEE